MWKYNHGVNWTTSQTSSIEKKPFILALITEQVQPKKQINISVGASFVFFDNPSHRYYYFIN